MTNDSDSSERKAAAILEARVRVPQHVVYRAFEEETVLLNRSTGQYHGLNPSGGRMLELIEETDGNVREAIELLAAEYGEDPADIEAGLASFCVALASRGLLELQGDGDR